MNNNKKALKSGMWYTASNFLVKSIGIITTPIFTRLLTKAEFGQYNNYISWLSIFSIFITLNLESTLISAKFDFKEDFDGYILSVLSLSSLSCSIWFFVYLLFGQKITELIHINPKYMYVMMIYMLFVPAIQLFQARERFLFEYKKTVISSVVLALSTAIVSVILVVNLDDKLLGRIIGAAAPTVFIGLLFYIFFIIKGKHLRITYWKYAIPICLPYIPHLLAGSLLNSMDRVMIENYCGSEDTAVYSLAYTCGTIVTLLVTALNAAFAPWLGEKLHEQKYNEIKRISNRYISLFFYLAVGIMLIAPEVLYLMGGKSYLEAIFVITPVAMGCASQFLYTLYVNIEQYKKKTVGMAIATIISALINYILNYIFIPRIGYLAAAYTTLVGFVCLLLMHMILVKRMGLLFVYDTKRVLLCLSIGLAAMVIITLLYNSNIARYVVIALYIILSTLLFRKYKGTIIKLIRGLK